MAGLSLRCGDCGIYLKSVEEAQRHIELTSHQRRRGSGESEGLAEGSGGGGSGSGDVRVQKKFHLTSTSADLFNLWRLNSIQSSPKPK